MDSDTKYVARHADQPSSRGSSTYNTLYQELGLNAVYLQFGGIPAHEFVSSMRSLHFVGSTIVGSLATLVLPLLDELDDSARRAGAVNTVAYGDGMAIGYKTDGPALVEALSEAVSLNGTSVAVAGAGHLVAEVVPLLRESGVSSVRVFARDEAAARDVASRLGVDLGGSPSALAETSADVLINATPIGARGCEDKRLLPLGAVSQFGAVLDTSFDPADTPLIVDAKAESIPSVSGLRMFAYQGAAQVRHYFGIDPPVDRIQALIGAEFS